MSVSRISRRPKPDPVDLGTFLLILDGFAPGATVTVEMVRDDLEAAQIKPSSYGSLFRAAARRGELVKTGRIVDCKPASRKGGSAKIWRRPRRKTATKTAARPATRRDSKGPRR